MIEIPFTREELTVMSNYLYDTVSQMEGRETRITILNIIDRIEKNLGIE